MKKQGKKIGNAGFSWLVKMAWRDGKASGRKLVLFMASIVLGIAAVVAIQSFGENLSQNFAVQSKSIMGADFIIDSRQPPNERVAQIIDSLGGANAREINFASMAVFPKSGATKLVRISGLEGDFPFYGSLDTAPASAAKTYQKDGAALVDATLMLQFNLQPGDIVKVGTITLPIAGAIKSVPGRSAISSTVAPAVFIPYRYIEETGLIQQGSRLEYQYYFVAKPGTDLDELHKTLEPKLDAEDADLDTHTDTSQRMGRRYENFGKFLNLVGFIALLLGCVGIASAIHIYIKDKLRSVAVLKCMGATRKQTFLIYLLQIAALGFWGGVLGTLVGVLLQQLSPLLLQNLLPVDVKISLSPTAIAMGILLGIFMSVLFALLPLISTWYVSPLRALLVIERTDLKSRKAGVLVMGAIVLFIFLFAFWLLDNWLYSLAFVGGILVTFSVLAGISSLFMRGIKKYFPSSLGFCVRQSLRNLYRPQNQTMTLVLAIGVGTFLISTLYFTKDLLLAKTTLDSQSGSPNIILLDVQTEQKDAVAGTILPKGLPLIDDIPIITMRVHSLKGIPISEIRKDSTSSVGNWVRNHEFRVTYRDTMISSETITSGKWVGAAESSGSLLISVAENFANDAKVGVGDEVEFNVQGKVLKTTVGSIREVDWGRLQLNFSIVFPLGVLEDAPKFHVLTTRAPDEQSSAKLQQELVRKFPNLSIIDLRQMLAIIENILDKISWVINFMALFSILTGIIVLVGAVRTSKYQRIRESVLLRTIGASGRQILKITALEYFFLGFLGTFSGMLLSVLSSYLLAWLLFGTPFIPTMTPFYILLPGITALVLVIGLVNSRSVLFSPPLEVLRKEGR